ncbi:hypothetical protein ERO13_D08G145801v2 [Gossypium hirsutum]|uniref:Uncharacterized protein n=1 Tax=Gossypium darwinii TaxID=34276 RepID=A0A5D2BNQ7_GOSDA|nr:hypothetical protein ERO13_D08G145801v2 [Gossypium hirsutum]TYG57733.1 hypothetical protein ES288_D08G166800v1 [Gossypium darwinii]
MLSLPAVGRFAAAGSGWDWGSSWTTGLMNMRRRSLASSSSSKSVVLRFIQEHRSNQAKKAEAMLAPTQRERAAHWGPGHCSLSNLSATFLLIQ